MASLSIARPRLCSSVSYGENPLSVAPLPVCATHVSCASTKPCERYTSCHDRNSGYSVSSSKPSKSNRTAWSILSPRSSLHVLTDRVSGPAQQRAVGSGLQQCFQERNNPCVRTLHR